MDKKKVVFVKSNVIDRDVRLPKVIEALRRSGYAVTFLCWDRREYQASKFEQSQNYEEIKLSLKAPMDFKILFFIPIWWCFVLLRLMVFKWDVAQATNFDSIVPTIIAGKLKRKPVVYEILDTYEDSIVLPKVVRRACIEVDKVFIRLASGIILADEAQIEEFGGIPNSKIVTIYDSPPDILDKTDIIHRKNDTFTLYYGGWLYKSRHLGLDKIVSAIKSIEGIKVVIAGHGDLVEEVREWSRQLPEKVQFVGRLSHNEALKQKANADLLFQLRDPLIPAYKYICGCTLLEAMMCSKPILVNKGTAAASKVSQEDCGSVVDANNIEELREAILKLKENRELLKELGANSRKAYEQRYSWVLMEWRLITLYQELLSKAGAKTKHHQR